MKEKEPTHDKNGNPLKKKPTHDKNGNPLDTRHSVPEKGPPQPDPMYSWHHLPRETTWLGTQEGQLTPQEQADRQRRKARERADDSGRGR